MKQFNMFWNIIIGLLLIGLMLYVAIAKLRVFIWERGVMPYNGVVLH